MPSIAIIRMDIRGSHEFAVLLNQDKTICGYHSVVEGVRDFETKYDEGHQRSYEGFMSTLLNWTFFRPSIVEVSDVKDIVNLVANPDQIQMTSYSNISGHFLGLVLDPEKAKAVWEQGAKPSLIS